MMPDGWLKQHFVLNSARLTAWETLQAEIDNVRRAQAATSSTQQPMDVSAHGAQGLDAFQKGKSRGKGKDKGKPKDEFPKTSCPICWKTVHWKRDCSYSEANLKRKGKGKDGKGKRSAGAATPKDPLPRTLRRRSRACRLWRVRRHPLWETLARFARRR